MIASSAIMIRPTAFGYNSETALSNSFQHSPMLTSTQVQLAAIKEFEKLHEELVNNGIEVILFNDTLTPVKPDAVFPNNWFSTHIDGTIFLYPMLSIARRKERREDIIERLRKNFSVRKIIDLSTLEMKGNFLEGTGSMVFDHKSKIIYAGLSPLAQECSPAFEPSVLVPVFFVMAFLLAIYFLLWHKNTTQRLHGILAPVGEPPRLPD